MVASVTSQSHSLHCLRFLGFVVVHYTDQAIVSISPIPLYLFIIILQGELGGKDSQNLVGYN